MVNFLIKFIAADGETSILQYLTRVFRGVSVTQK